jgi:hypothetical protein
MIQYDLCKYIFDKLERQKPVNDSTEYKQLYENIASVFSKPVAESSFATVSITSIPPDKDFSFIPPELRIHVMRCKTPILSSITIHLPSGCKVQVYLWLPYETDRPYQESMISKIHHWLLFIDPHMCSKNLTIYMYMIDEKKTLPANSSSMIDRKHVNGGFSYPCKKDNVIYIFRREEWFKVFVHETLHNSVFDFSTKNYDDVQLKIKEGLFPGVDQEYLALSETFVEIWATVFAILVNVYDTTKQPLYTRHIHSMISRCLDFERLWSIIQVIKVLHHQGLTYQELLSGSKYQEGESNVFAYYVLKSIAINQMGDVFDFKNKSLEFNITNLGKLILKNGGKNEFLMFIQEVQSYTKYFDTSLRMSLLG